MQLNEFTPTNCPSIGRTGEPRLTINKAGAVSISKSAAEHIGLCVGDKIVVVQDNDSPQDWYIISNGKKSNGGGGGRWL